MIENKNLEISTKELDNGKFEITSNAVDIADAQDVVNNAKSLRDAIMQGEKLLADIDSNVERTKKQTKDAIESNRKRLNSIEAAEKRANEIIESSKPVAPIEAK